MDESDASMTSSRIGVRFGSALFDSIGSNRFEHGISITDSINLF